MNNEAHIKGVVTKELTFDHELFGEKYYRTIVETERKSGATDYVPVIVSERLFDKETNYKGLLVGVDGQFRTYNHKENGKCKLLLFIFATDFHIEADQEKENEVYLEGYIGKEPIYRKTPLGREIADLLLVVPRSYGKNDFIPCISWGRAARFVKGLCVGDEVKVKGRAQSREYTKGNEIKTAYELSIDLITT